MTPFESEAQVEPQTVAPQGSGLSSHRVHLLRSHINEHLAEPLLLPDLAAVVGLSVFHFCRMFKVSLGCSPHRYVMDERVARAKALLMETPLPIREIAAMVGFRTHAHFSGVFRSSVGTTPRRFRESSGDRSASANDGEGAHVVASRAPMGSIGRAPALTTSPGRTAEVGADHE